MFPGMLIALQGADTPARTRTMKTSKLFHRVEVRHSPRDHMLDAPVPGQRKPQGAGRATAPQRPDWSGAAVGVGA